MNDPIKELIAIGASVGTRCQPCLEYHLQAAIELGLSPDEISQAIEIGQKVEKGGMAAMKKFSEGFLAELLAAAPRSGLAPVASANACCGGKECC